MSTLHFFQRKVLRIESGDNVAVALTDLFAGDSVEVGTQKWVLRSSVSAKQKFALKDFAVGDSIVMYGVVVGEALEPIECGVAITTENIRHRSSEFGRRRATYSWVAPDISKWKERTFRGFHRSDGQVGSRNYWLVVPLVFCENGNILRLQQAFDKELGASQPESYGRQVAELLQLYKAGKIDEIREYRVLADGRASVPARAFEHVDGVRFLTHQMGCGGTRDDARSLCGLIAGYFHHPNVAGGVVLSLGCQNAQVEVLREEIQKRSPRFEKRLIVLEQQATNLESDLLSSAIRETILGLAAANEARRTPAPLSSLTVGLKCGGSDGFSGISANPAIGHLSDIICALGGRTILSEFPELCGVEQNLIDRCVTEEAGERFAALMKRYAERAAAVGSGFDMNPSPGNIRDGLITDAMKSAGAGRKGGTAPVSDVLDYPEYATKAGLHLLCTPGNDVEAVTAQVGAGANVVLFTTGLGTPTGNPISPVVKISTNTELAKRMHDIIDIDTGSVVRGESTIEAVGETILEEVIRVASGEKLAKAEHKSHDDFIPWKRGVSL